MNNSNHHFFATFALGWTTAATRKEAIEKLIKRFSSEFKLQVKQAHLQSQIGAYIWSCKVEAPEDTNYSINFYQPEGVPISDAIEHSVLKVTGKATTYIDTVPVVHVAAGA